MCAGGGSVIDWGRYRNRQAVAAVLHNYGTPQVTFKGVSSTFSYIEIGKYNFVNIYLPFRLFSCPYSWEFSDGLYFSL